MIEQIRNRQGLLLVIIGIGMLGFLVPYDAVYDRSDVVHQVNLFDMGQKYADVVSTDGVIEILSRLASERSA